MTWLRYWKTYFSHAGSESCNSFISSTFHVVLWQRSKLRYWLEIEVYESVMICWCRMDIIWFLIRFHENILWTSQSIFPFSCPNIERTRERLSRLCFYDYEITFISVDVRFISFNYTFALYYHCLKEIKDSLRCRDKRLCRKKVKVITFQLILDDFRDFSRDDPKFAFISFSCHCTEIKGLSWCCFYRRKKAHNKNRDV